MDDETARALFKKALAELRAGRAQTALPLPAHHRRRNLAGVEEIVDAAARRASVKARNTVEDNQLLLVRLLTDRARFHR